MSRNQAPSSSSRLGSWSNDDHQSLGQPDGGGGPCGAPEGWDRGLAVLLVCASAACASQCRVLWRSSAWDRPPLRVLWRPRDASGMVSGDGGLHATG